MEARNWIRSTVGMMVPIFLFCGIGAGGLHAAQFSADLIMSMDLRVTTGQVYVSGSHYRMDLQTPVGPDVVVIVDQSAKMTKVLVPMFKSFMEMPSDDQMSVMNDPFQAAESMLQQYSLEEVGSETIAGYDCTKQLILSKSEYGDSQIMYRWISADLGFPLKLEMLMQEDTFTELSGIKEEPVAESMFQVPAGFEKATWEDIAARSESDPELAAKMESFKKTRRVKARLSKRMSPGHEIHVLIREGVEVRVKGEPAYDKPFNLYVKPFKNGKALKEDAACTYDEPMSFTLEAGLNPDLIVSGTGEGGEASLELVFVGQMPVILATLEEYFSSGGRTWTINDPYEKLSIRITADNEQDSSTSIARGEFNVGTGGWEDRKTDSYEFELAEGETKSFEFSKADEISELDFMIQNGRVRVQYIVDNRPGAPEAPPFPGKP